MRFFLNFSDKDAAMLSTKGTTVLRILVTALGNVLEKRTGFNDDFKIAIFKKAGIAKRPEKGVRKAVCNYGIVFVFAAKKFNFGMCDCTVDSDVGMGEFSLVLGILLGVTKQLITNLPTLYTRYPLVFSALV